MIKVENITKTFGDFVAVDHVSFTVQDGENLVLLGRSGCGKTTLLKMINRLIEPSSGEIYIDSDNIHDRQPEELRKKIGYVFQDTGLFPHYTIAENIAIVPRLLGWDKQKIQQRTALLMDKLHLPGEYLSYYPPQLSGGQQQRVGLARALAADPPVLLMDEPFGALDPITRASIKKDFMRLDELKNKTIVMVTHDVQEAFELGHRICLMDKGRIVQAGSQKDLLLNPSDDYVRDFFEDQRFQLEASVIGPKDYDALIRAFGHFKNKGK